MKIQAKEILIIIMGVAITIILTILFENKLIDVGNFSSKDVLILVVVAIIAIVYIIYKRIGEIDEDIENIRKDYYKLDERLKISNQLINLEARVIALEKGKKWQQKMIQLKRS